MTMSPTLAKVDAGLVAGRGASAAKAPAPSSAPVSTAIRDCLVLRVGFGFKGRILVCFMLGMLSNDGVRQRSLRDCSGRKKGQTPCAVSPFPDDYAPKCVVLGVARQAYRATDIGDAQESRLRGGMRIM